MVYNYNLSTPVLYKQTSFITISTYLCATGLVKHQYEHSISVHKYMYVMLHQVSIHDINIVYIIEYIVNNHYYFWLLGNDVIIDDTRTEVLVHWKYISN